jgi:hypothetical protein
MELFFFTMNLIYDYMQFDCGLMTVISGFALPTPPSVGLAIHEMALISIFIWVIN